MAQVDKLVAFGSYNEKDVSYSLSIERLKARPLDFDLFSPRLVSAILT